MRLHIRHTTCYRYAAPVRSVIQLLRVTPASFTGQTVLDWRLDVDCDARIREGRDGYGNIIHMLYVDRPVRDLGITVSGRVLTDDEMGVVRGLPVDLPPQVFCRQTMLTNPGEALTGFAEEVWSAGEVSLDRLHFLTSALHSRMRFDTAATEVETQAEQAFAAGHGVCQDFSHIFIGTARQLGIPARYVSGHLFRRDGAVLQRPPMPGSRPGSTISAGSPSIQPTANARTTPMSGSPAASTIATPPPLPGRGAAAARKS